MLQPQAGIPGCLLQFFLSPFLPAQGNKDSSCRIKETSRPVSRIHAGAPFFQPADGSGVDKGKQAGESEMTQSLVR
jgi:hypothetical protein